MSHLASHGVRLIGVGVVAVLFACGDNVSGPTTEAVALHLRPIAADGPFAINLGTSLALEALPIAADSTVVAGPIAATWRSSDTTVVGITAQGVLQSHCAGSTTVVATAPLAGRSLSGTLPIIVASTGTACAPN